MSPIQRHDDDDEALGESLTIREHRAAEFIPAALDEEEIARRAVQAEQLLRRLQIIEDSRGREDSDEHDFADHALQRIEARLELLTALVSRVMERRGESRALDIAWSAEGAVLPVPPPGPAGTTGWLRLQPADWLPDAIALPARVLATRHEQRLRLRFESMPGSLTASLEQHLFRMHRREVAEQRRNR